jgi:hypothetical protein
VTSAFAGSISTSSPDWRRKHCRAPGAAHDVRRLVERCAPRLDYHPPGLEPARTASARSNGIRTGELQIGAFWLARGIRPAGCSLSPNNRSLKPEAHATVDFAMTFCRVERWDEGQSRRASAWERRQFVMAGLVPAIRAVRRSRPAARFAKNWPKHCFVNTSPWPMLEVWGDRCDMSAWMAGTSPAMTERGGAGPGVRRALVARRQKVVVVAKRLACHAAMGLANPDNPLSTAGSDGARDGPRRLRPPKRTGVRAE